MFVELGQALMKRELWEKALDCFASINEEDAVSFDYLSRPGNSGANGRLRTNHLTSLHWEYVYIRLEKQNRPLITSNGVGLTASDKS